MGVTELEKNVIGRKKVGVTEHPTKIFAYQVNAKVISYIFCRVSTRCARLKYMTWERVPNE